jgi:hypothetical protein
MTQTTRRIIGIATATWAINLIAGIAIFGPSWPIDLIRTTTAAIINII